MNATILSNVGQQILLIAPYGIEMSEHHLQNNAAGAFNRTIWN